MLETANKISNWVKEYAINAEMTSLVIGCSGGVDSTLVSTLCAMTGLDTYCLILPINQNPIHTSLEKHIEWLWSKYNNVHGYKQNLSDIYNVFNRQLSVNFDSELGFANSKARLRMIALYQVASSVNGLVIGTGNKIEDFGVGFATKHGDLACDISPIADLYKSEVYTMAKELGVIEDILNAEPTDGLWDDDRTDEQQLKCSYSELESVMKGECTDQRIIDIYNYFHNKNLHKMNPIPICKL